MANVLTEASTIKCPHAAKVIPVATGKLRVGESKVLVAANISSGSFAPPGCSNKPPPNSNVPCTKIASLSGAATKLTVGQQAVVLESSVAKTNGSVPTPVSLQANQAKLTAV